MFNKKVNLNKIHFLFLEFALMLIMCYVVILTMFLSMPPEGMLIYEVASIALYLLESIMSSLAITSVIFYILVLTVTYRK